MRLFWHAGSARVVNDGMLNVAGAIAGTVVNLASWKRPTGSPALPKMVLISES